MLVPVGTARRSRKALKPQENMLVFRKFSVIDWKPQHCTKQHVWMGRDTPLILAAMSHGGWIISAQHNQLGTTNFPADRRKFALLLHNHASHLRMHALNEGRITPQSTDFPPRAAMSTLQVEVWDRGLEQALGHQLQIPSHQWGCMGWLCSRSSEL